MIIPNLNGRPVGSAKGRGPIARDPNDVMQIRADLGSAAVEGPGFKGLVESVHLFCGEREVKAIAEDEAVPK